MSISRFETCVTEESCYGNREIKLTTKHFENRRLFLYGKVTDEMADEFLMQMLFLQNENSPIDIYINSPGGSVNAGLVIYDLLQSATCEINIYVVGMAASMGAVILAGGQKGHRFILPHSKVMIHEPLIAGGMGGSASTIERTAESILETKRVINEILAHHTGKSIEEINEATCYDNIMNAQEAIDFGLCDEIKSI